MWWQIVLVIVGAPIIELVVTFVVELFLGIGKKQAFLNNEQKSLKEGTDSRFIMALKADSKSLMVLGIVAFSLVIAFDLCMAVLLYVSDDVPFWQAAVFGGAVAAVCGPILLAMTYFLKRRIWFSEEGIAIKRFISYKFYPLESIVSAEERRLLGEKRLVLVRKRGRKIKITEKYYNYFLAKEFFMRGKIAQEDNYMAIDELMPGMSYLDSVLLSQIYHLENYTRASEKTQLVLNRHKK